MKKQKKFKKTKEINLPMEFNPALMNYEPKLPLSEEKIMPKIIIDWRWATALIIIFLLIISYYFSY